MIDNMNKGNELNEMGKNLPYTVPDHFFADMQQRISQRVAEESKESAAIMALPPRRFHLRWLLAAAACAVVLIVSGVMFLYRDRTTDMDDVVYAFDQLDEQDQDYVLAVSEDDIFMDETN